MELDLDIRAPAAPVRVDFVRNLTEGDAVLMLEDKPPVPRPSLLKIKAKHHEAARAFAEGLSRTEIGLRTGYSPAMLSTLAQDPAFQELVSGYQQMAADAWDTNIRRAATVNLSFLEQIEERLEDESKPLTVNELYRGYELTGKMAGLGQPKAATQVNINMNLSDRIHEARRRAMIIDGVLAQPSIEEPIA